MKHIKADGWLAIVVIAGAAIYLYMDLQLPEVRLSDPLGPKAFPALVGVGLIASALLLLFEGHSKARHPAHTEDATEPAPTAAGKSPDTTTTAAVVELRTAPTPDASAASSLAACDCVDANGVANRGAAASNAHAAHQQPKHSAFVLPAMVLWTIAYYFAFDRAGYLVATTVFLIGLLSYFNRKRIKTNLAIALGVTVVFDLLFSQLLGVPMPRGFLPF